MPTIAFESPDFPEDIEGRRKFLGQTCWNMMRRELTQCIQKKQPILFTDLGESGEGHPYTVVDPHDTRQSPTGLTSSSSWPLSSWG